MTLYDRLPDLIEGCNELVRKSGVRRRITVCFRCHDHSLIPSGPHFIARRIDRLPESVFA